MVVIGRAAMAVPATTVWDHVAGLTLGQDISDRTVQRAGNPPQFSLGKSFDGYGPLGPVVVSPDGFDDPDDVGLWCDVSGERMQDSRTGDLIFSVPALVAHLSSICTLVPGDLIFTGTPSGVGAARGRFLRPGDVVVVGGRGDRRAAQPLRRRSVQRASRTATPETSGPFAPCASPGAEAHDEAAT